MAWPCLKIDSLIHDLFRDWRQWKYKSIKTWRLTKKKKRRRKFTIIVCSDKADKDSRTFMLQRCRYWYMEHIVGASKVNFRHKFCSTPPEIVMFLFGRNILERNKMNRHIFWRNSKNWSSQQEINDIWNMNLVGHSRDQILWNPTRKYYKYIKHLTYVPVNTFNWRGLLINTTTTMEYVSHANGWVSNLGRDRPKVSREKR